MVVIVTCNVLARFRGFLASCMLEIAPGVYTSPNMTKGVRERVWSVLSSWYSERQQGSIIMTWQEKSLTSHQGILTLGYPHKIICLADDVYLTFTPPPLPCTLKNV